MKKEIRILHLEDNAVDADLFRMILASEAIECTISRARGRREFQAALEQGGFDLIVSDFSIPAFDGFTALSMARERHPSVPFIFLSGTLRETEASEALRCGARAFVNKDDVSGLIAAIRSAVAGR